MKNILQIIIAVCNIDYLDHILTNNYKYSYALNLNLLSHIILILFIYLNVS